MWGRSHRPKRYHWNSILPDALREKNIFLILLAYTEKKNALTLNERVREALEKLDFGTYADPKFKFSATRFSNEAAA